MKSKIQQLVEKYRACQGELRDLEKRMVAASEDCARYANQSFDNKEVQRAFKEASMTFDICKLRRDKMQVPRRDELLTTLQLGIESWNKRVAKIRETIQEGIVRANLPFWSNDERACRRWLDEGNFVRMPVLNSFAELFYQHYYTAQLDMPRLVQTAENFLKHIQRLSVSLNINLEELSL